MSADLVERRQRPRLERRVRVQDINLYVSESMQSGRLLLSLADVSVHITPEQALECAQMLAECALYVAQARPAQMLVVPGQSGLTSVRG